MKKVLPSVRLEDCEFCNWDWDWESEEEKDKEVEEDKDWDWERDGVWDSVWSWVRKVGFCISIVSFTGLSAILIKISWSWLYLLIN